MIHEPQDNSKNPLLITTFGQLVLNELFINEILHIGESVKISEDTAINCQTNSTYSLRATTTVYRLFKIRRFSDRPYAPVPPKTEDQLVFESSFKVSQSFSGDNLEWGSDGKYLHSDIQTGWEMWQLSAKRFKLVMKPCA